MGQRREAYEHDWQGPIRCHRRSIAYLLLEARNLAASSATGEETSDRRA